MVLQLKDPLKLFVKRREFLPGFRFLSCRDMTLAVESKVKPHYIPSFSLFILLLAFLYFKALLFSYNNKGPLFNGT